MVDRMLNREELLRVAAQIYAGGRGQISMLQAVEDAGELICHVDKFCPPQSLIPTPMVKTPKGQGWKA